MSGGMTWKLWCCIVLTCNEMLAIDLALVYPIIDTFSVNSLHAARPPSSTALAFALEQQGTWQAGSFRCAACFKYGCRKIKQCSPAFWSKNTAGYFLWQRICKATNRAAKTPPTRMNLPTPCSKPHFALGNSLFSGQHATVQVCAAEGSRGQFIHPIYDVWSRPMQTLSQCLHFQTTRVDSIETKNFLRSVVPSFFLGGCQEMPRFNCSQSSAGQGTKSVC